MSVSLENRPEGKFAGSYLPITSRRKCMWQRELLLRRMGIGKIL